jgi:glucose-1-phosphate thymidylyltransferase
MKGIILAGGSGTRLWPITRVVSKQLLPIYDKPMIYYPISTLMLSGVREILVITSPNDLESFQNLLGDGSKFGVEFSYAVQPKPEGLAQALIIGQDFLGVDTCLMILGDNIFHGVGLGQNLEANLPSSGAKIFSYLVSNPNQYGVVTIDEENNPISIEEKPASPQSNLAITGLYFFDSSGPERAKKVEPSKRGELEITSVLNSYLRDNLLSHTPLSRGTVWLDTGNPDSMSDAIDYVRIVEARSGLKIACLEEIALNFGWITPSELSRTIQTSGEGTYARYLKELISHK